MFIVRYLEGLLIKSAYRLIVCVSTFHQCVFLVFMGNLVNNPVFGTVDKNIASIAFVNLIINEKGIGNYSHQ